MTCKVSQKLSDKGTEFLNRFGANRVIIKMENRALSYADLVEIIANYFKQDNDRYLELVNMEFKK